MNEMTTNKVSVEFKPATLEIQNFEELNKAVEQVAAKYDGLVFEAEDKKVAEASRSELLEVRNAIEDRRKAIKKEYNKPLKEFEENVKVLTGKIDKPLNDIREGLKIIEEGEREQRYSQIVKFIEEEIKDLEITFDEIEQSASWTNKGNFTTRGKLNSKTKNEIKDAISYHEREKVAKQKQESALVAFCEAVGVEAKGWLGQLEYKPVDEIIEQIKDTLEDEEEAQPEEVEEQPEANIFEEEKPVFKEMPKPRVIHLRATQADAEKAIQLLLSQGFDARLEQEQLNIFDGIE